MDSISFQFVFLWIIFKFRTEKERKRGKLSFLRALCAGGGGSGSGGDGRGRTRAQQPSRRNSRRREGGREVAFSLSIHPAMPKIPIGFHFRIAFISLGKCVSCCSTLHSAESLGFEKAAWYNNTTFLDDVTSQPLPIQGRISK